MAHQYILRTLNVIKFNDFKMTNFNNQDTLLGQIKFAITEILNKMKIFSDFRGYHSNDEYFGPANSYLFNSSVPIVLFNNYFLNSTMEMSLSDALNMIVVRLTEIVDYDPTKITNWTLLSPSMRNPFYNIKSIDNYMADVSDLIADFVTETIDHTNHILFIAVIAISILLAVILSIIIYIIWKRISKDKNTVYRTLMVLPKNVVSQISEALRIVKTDETATKNNNLRSNSNISSEMETSKQEENLLKVLTAATDENSSVGEILHLTICMLIIMVCCILIEVSMTKLYMDQGNAISKNSRHVHNIMATATFLDLMTMNVNDLASILKNKTFTDFLL